MLRERGHKPGELRFVGRGGKVTESGAIGRGVNESDEQLNGGNLKKVFHQKRVKEREQPELAFSAEGLVEGGKESCGDKSRKINMRGNQLKKPCRIGFGKVGKIDEIIENTGLMRNRHWYFLRFGFFGRNKIIPKTEKKYNLRSAGTPVNRAKTL